MKKTLLLLVSLLLCCAVFAQAESTPSIAVEDLTRFDVTLENASDAAGYGFTPIIVDEVTNEVVGQAATMEMAKFSVETRVQCNTNELAKLTSATTADAYFGKATDAQGTEVSLFDMLGSETLAVNEFVAVYQNGYDASFGAVTVDMYFPTVYDVNEKVAVLIGVVTVAEDQTQTVQWFAYEGTVLPDGGVQVKLDAQSATMFENALLELAIISK